MDTVPSPHLDQVANITIEDLKKKKSVRFTTWFTSKHYLSPTNYNLNTVAALLSIAPKYIPYMKEAVSITSIIFSKAALVFFAKLGFTKLSLEKEKVTQRKKTKGNLRLLSYA